MPSRCPHPAALCRLLVVGLLTAAPLTGCGAPPELRQHATPPTTPSAGPTATPIPTGTPSTPGVPSTPTPTTAATGSAATACGPAGPSADRVVRLLRGPAGVLPGGVRVAARTGPLCADEWQYTMLDVTGHEALQVVTRGRPGSLRLVTAGTDVCTVEVRTAAPPGIRALACVDDPLAGTGA